jgi:hypothetical protein
MKLIVAYIQPEKLNDVKQELYKAEVYRMSATNALGCGRQMGFHESYRFVGTRRTILRYGREIHRGFLWCRAVTLCPERVAARTLFAGTEIAVYRAVRQSRKEAGGRSRSRTQRRKELWQQKTRNS